MANITKRLVESVKPRSADFILWDNELPAFGLRVRPSGRKTFVIQYKNLRRQSRRMTLGTTKTLTPEAARDRARRLLQAARDGDDPAANRAALREGATVKDLGGRYIEVHAKPKKKPSSVRTDEMNLRLHVYPQFGRLVVADVKPADVTRLHAGMSETPGAANRVLALLSKMLNLAEKEGLRPFGSNPCRHVERYPERKMERFLSGEELARLGTVLAEAERTKTEPVSVIAAIRLLLFTGCRVSEILTLKWAEVDLERGLLNLRESKTGPKPVFLNAPARTVLVGLKPKAGKNRPFVLPGVGGNEPVANLRRPWHRIREKAGLGGARLHDLRHSFASVGAGAGLGLPVIGRLLGHAAPSTTQRYAHLGDDPLKRASDVIAGQIEAALEGKSAAIVDLEAEKRRRPKLEPAGRRR